MRDITGAIAHQRAPGIANCILLVDDSAAIRRGLRREFEGAGWIVCGEAASGREAIEKAEQLHPQVILLDLVMPEINGLTTARLLKRAMPNVPLILFTGHGDLFKSNEASSAGIDAVFSKTGPIEDLLDKAKRLVKKGSA
jgi:two-component system, NarL family, vancomycin resistance associated response regulator VraR